MGGGAARQPGVQMPAEPPLPHSTSVAPSYNNGASPWHLARRCWGCGRDLLTKSRAWKHKVTQNPGQGVDGGKTDSLSPVRPKGTSSLFLVLLRIVPRAKSARQALYPLCLQASVHFLVVFLLRVHCVSGYMSILSDVNIFSAI